VAKIDELKSALVEAQKTKEVHKVETLRGLLASIHNEEIAKRSRGDDSTLSDDEIILVLQKEAKKRKESAEVYGGANRSELEEKENKELSMIEEYLPAALTRDEVHAIVKNVVDNGEDNFGKVMGMSMAEIVGRADAKLVTEVVKEHLRETE